MEDSSPQRRAHLDTLPPTLSVVVPVHNGGLQFQQCLQALARSTFQQFELVVVDDGSTDDSAQVASAHHATLLKHPAPLGPAAARNVGARAARAPLVFFLDADVVVHPDTISRGLAHFDRIPNLSALFGSYDDQPSAPGLVSQYRNLLHHYVHQQGDFDHNTRPAHTFWTGCGMIRRDVFLQLGGFDPELYRRPAIEDIEFGYRLSRAGFHTVIARDVLATHLKHWTLRSVLKTDVFQRGVPWMLLMMRSQVVETDLNVSKTQRLCVASTGLGLAALPLTPLHPLASLPLLINLLILLRSNFPFYRFLASRKGTAFAAASFPLHYLYFCSCGISVAIAAAIKIAADQKAARSRQNQTHNPNPIPRPASLRYATRRRQRNKTSSNAPSRGKPPA